MVTLPLVTCSSPSVSPSQSTGVSSEDIQRLRVALGGDVEGAVSDVKRSLLGWLEGNMTEVLAVTDGGELYTDLILFSL